MLIVLDVPDTISVTTELRVCAAGGRGCFTLPNIDNLVSSGQGNADI